MVDLKQISSPKVAFPLVGIVLLISVSILVTIFYIRNPTITDGIFGKTDGEASSTGLSIQPELSDSSSTSATPSGNQGLQSSQTIIPYTTSTSKEFTSTIITTVFTSVTSPSPETSTLLHPIEPVQHM